MSPTIYVVTGANRGIGLELVRHLLSSNPEARVIATARNPSQAGELQALVEANEGRAVTLKLDLTNLEGVKAAAEEAAKLPVAADGIDVVNGASKTASNMIVVKLARALEPEGFTVPALHPGMVDTEMGHAVAEISPKESAEKSLATFASKGPAQSGTFWSYTGKELTW